MAPFSYPWQKVENPPHAITTTLCDSFFPEAVRLLNTTLPSSTHMSSSHTAHLHVTKLHQARYSY